ncbi:MAG: alpha/beta hydrolase [Oscillospiraceae bacterium]|nr:alpha/beta hydrolase [Oscillospiraceae bacterium]
MPKFSDSSFLSANGKNQIHLRRCDPDGEVRAVVQIAHGIAEHVGRYDDFAAFLAERGYAVAANDHLGHGGSVDSPEGLGFAAKRGGWGFMVDDMRQVFEQMSGEYPGVPYFLFGHSMGSFLSRTYIILHRAGLSGCVLCGTGQQSPAAITLGKNLGMREIRRHGAEYKSERLNDLVFGGYNYGFNVARTTCDWLSRDEASVDKYIEDPLCGFVPSAALFRDMMGGLEFITRQRCADRMAKLLPVLFISGDADPVGERGAGVIRAYQMFLRAGLEDVTLKLYHGARHELLNEVNREQVYGDVLCWLDSKLAAAEKKSS